MTFGVVICHEGFRYPETVRWAARRGAQVVFHPHAHVAEPGSHRPTSFAEPANSFHEKAMLCRAAENTCYFASVNFASERSGTTSAIVRPDGTLQCFSALRARGPAGRGSRSRRRQRATRLELAAFEEVVESELEVQLEGVAPKLVCRLLPFEAFSIDASVRLIYDNPWAIE